MDALGWNTLLFAFKWVFIGLVYFVLVLVLLNVRREMALRASAVPPAEADFSAGSLKVIQAGSDKKIRPGKLLALKPDTTLGALPDNDVVLRDRFVSGHHARLTWDGVGWWLEDLGSRNGSFINHERLAAGTPTQVPANALITIGEMTFNLIE